MSEPVAKKHDDGMQFLKRILAQNQEKRKPLMRAAFLFLRKTMKNITLQINGEKREFQYKPYSPRGKNPDILDRAYELLTSVKYRVSLRWVFYKLWDERFIRGWWKDKSKTDAYDSFWAISANARKRFYKNWRPWTLIDKTRGALYDGFGSSNPVAWWNDYKNDAICVLEKVSSQDYYVEIWFEARAMIDQFKYYTKYITLRPMAGFSSITFMWETADFISKIYRKYNKPVRILYFGDLDDSGKKIYKNACDRMDDWCQADYEVIRCGLTPEQAAKYNLPENWEKPGHQWESLDDIGANEIITNAVKPFIRLARTTEIEAIENRTTETARLVLNDLELPNV